MLHLHATVNCYVIRRQSNRSRPSVCFRSLLNQWPWLFACVGLWAMTICSQWIENQGHMVKVSKDSNAVVLSTSVTDLGQFAVHTQVAYALFCSVLFFSRPVPSWCCPPRPCVVFLACVHPALFLALSLSPGNSLVSSWCDYSMLASLLWRCLTVPSLLQVC